MGEVIAGEADRRAARRSPVWRRLTSVAAVALVAGLGIALWADRPALGRVPGAPAGSPTPPAPVLTGARWLATEIGGKPVEESASVSGREKVPWLEFDAATMSGGDPCNGVGADYRLDGDRLSFEGWHPQTEIGCNGAQQQRFGAALRAVTRVQQDGDELAFLDASDTVVLRLRGAPEETPTPTSPATGVTSAYRLRVHNGTGVALDDVRVQPRTGDAVNLGSLKTEGTSELVVVPWVDDQAVVTGSAGDVRYRFTQDSYRGEAEWAPGDYTYTLRLASDGRTFFGFSGWASTAPDPGVVQVRVRNGTGFDFAGVEVRFPDGTRLSQGPLASGASSDYIDAGDPVYGYAWAKVTTAPGPPADGRVFVLQPADYVGEQALAPGQYTYVLALDDQENLQLTLEKDG